MPCFASANRKTRIDTIAPLIADLRQGRSTLQIRPRLLWPVAAFIPKRVSWSASLPQIEINSNLERLGQLRAGASASAIAQAEARALSEKGDYHEEQI